MRAHRAVRSAASAGRSLSTAARFQCLYAAARPLDRSLTLEGGLGSKNAVAEGRRYFSRGMARRSAAEAV